GGRIRGQVIEIVGAVESVSPARGAALRPVGIRRVRAVGPLVGHGVVRAIVSGRKGRRAGIVALACDFVAVGAADYGVGPGVFVGALEFPLEELVGVEAWIDE